MGEVTFSAGALAIIGALLTALCGTIGLLFRGLIDSKDAQMADIMAQRNSYQRMAYQSIAAMELAANKARKSRGESPFEVVPPVVPEHNSPTTQRQFDAAEHQTLLARSAAAARDLGIPLDADVQTPSIPNGLVVPQPMTLRPGESVIITASSAAVDLTTNTPDP